jgi:carboxyl-terminal processing protease
MINIFRNLNKKVEVFIISAFLVVSSTVFLAFNEKDFEITKNLDIFITLFREIDLFYVDNKSPEELINAGINGMLESLDPYTTYIPEANTDEIKFMTTGQYGGIGALIRQGGDYIIITEPYESFPAQKAGLHAGDTLISINGISTKSKSVNDVSQMLKGTPNTRVEVKLKRIGDTSIISKDFLREKITIKNVPYFGIIDNQIGYIRLGNFTNEASIEVKNAFLDLKKKGAKSIIIDLRGNPGGLLNEAVDITNIWVNKGQEVVSTRGKAKQWDNVYKTEKTAEDTLIPIAVLVDRGSASASEIVAGSLQDLDRAIIVGQRTFGKGLVQTNRPLSYNTHLKITTAKYYIPSGRCIQALDYSHRNEDGSVGHIPDSLISEFKTKNGRLVYDGGGIIPDIKVEVPVPANITFKLYAENLIFDYATYFASVHDSIDSPEKFEVTDYVYNDFLNYLKSKKFDYATTSNEKLDELIESAKSEGYYNIAKNEIDALREKLKADKNKDLELFKSEIKTILRDDIISRYYYQKGSIISSLRNDSQLDKAIELLKKPETISLILHGTYAEGEIKLALEKK